MAIRDLDELLANLSARQRPGRWCLVSGAAVPAGVEVAATVVEDEGVTAVVRVTDAERLGVAVDFVAAWLTLEVHSALEAVGLTAAVSAALAAEQIPANVLAGFHHDHLLVPYDDADRAMAAIGRLRTRSRARLDLAALVVDDYDLAIDFFVDALGFELVEDSPSTTDDGRPKRWVVVRPPGAETGLLLARADGDRQRGAVGNQVAGRVGFFLRVDDFDAAHRRMVAAGVTFVTEVRHEPYGSVAVFLDVSGNRWDLLGPAAGSVPEPG